jgi:ABC-type sugar transport system ATPase subunit
MSDLRLKKVSKSFGSVSILHDVDLEVKDGEFVVFVGPSGCGKSTLLRLISGLDRPSGGDVFIDGKLVNDVPAADRGLAMVFQSYALYPHMSVRQNLAFGLENTRIPRPEIEQRIGDAARMLEIAGLLDRRPGQLSGGQRQRVAIGRAIVRRPGIFLLDEPLSNLDAELRVTMRAELAALHARLSATMIYVTHDQIEAMTLADRIVVLRAGRVEQIGTPLELYNQPANRFVAGFIGAPHMNFFQGAVTSDGKGGKRIELRGGHHLAMAAGHLEHADGELTIGVRPQHIKIGKRDDGAAAVAARVRLVEELGSETVVHATAEGQPRIVATLPGQQRVRSGDSVALSFDWQDMHLFGEDGRRLPLGQLDGTKATGS